MNPLTHYQTLAAQAEALQAEQAMSTNLAAKLGRDMFLDSLRAGRDAPFPMGFNARSYKVSSYLGECDRHNQGLLFAACAAALSECDPEVVKARLAAFAHAVAREYGEDSADAWDDEERDE